LPPPGGAGAAGDVTVLVSVAVDVTVFGGFGEVVVSVEKTVERTVVLEIVVETLFVVEVVVRVLTTCFGPAATRKATATPSPSASAETMISAIVRRSGPPPSPPSASTSSSPGVGGVKGVPPVDC